MFRVCSERLQHQVNFLRQFAHTQAGPDDEGSSEQFHEYRYGEAGLLLQQPVYGREEEQGEPDQENTKEGVVSPEDVYQSDGRKEQAGEPPGSGGEKGREVHVLVV